MAQHDIIILQRNGAGAWVERIIAATAGYVIRFDPATSVLVALPFPVVGTMGTQNANAVAIAGGTIDAVSLVRVDNALGTAKAFKAGAAIGSNSRRTGSFPSVGVGSQVTPAIDLHIASNYGAQDYAGIFVDNFGPSFWPILMGRRASGSFASPTATLVNQILAAFGGRGHDGTIFDDYDGASIQIIATENRTPTDGGTKMEIRTTPNTTVAPALAMTIDEDQNVYLEKGLRIGAAGALIANTFTATGSLNFGSIAAAASADLTIPVVGAVVGDAVALGLPAAPEAGIIFMAFVSAADTVTVRATNITVAPIDPAAANYRVTVFNY